MTTAAVDLEKLRVVLHRMNRGNLLILAERAVELVPRAKLRALVGDLVRLEDPAREAAQARLQRAAQGDEQEASRKMPTLAASAPSGPRAGSR
jgi:hypothetical protein